MLFTAQLNPRSVPSSKLFEQYGAKELSPAPVSKTRIFPIPTKASFKRMRNLKNFLAPCITAFNKMEAVAKSTFSSDHAVRHSQADNLFPIPMAVTTFVRPKESTIARIKEAGFQQSSMGRYQYFTGVGSSTAIMTLSNLGGDLYAYAPAERVSLAGHMCAEALRNLLFATYMVCAVIPENTKMSWPVEIPDEIISMSKQFQLKKSSYRIEEIPDAAVGHFFPYFAGLVLPDKDLIHDIIEVFKYNIGSTDAIRENTMGVLTRGWISFHNTTGGRVYSHMFFTLLLAIRGGFSPEPVFIRGEYIGTVLYGQGSMHYNTKVVKPSTGHALREEMISMTSHESTLRKVAAAISVFPLRATKETEVVTADDLDTARALHYACADRKIPEESQNEILKLVKGLKYRQTFFKALDPDSLVTVLTALCHKDRLDKNAPFDIANTNLFTKSNKTSIFAAYGSVAPAPISNKKNPNFTIAIRPGFETRNIKEGQLPGFPIFLCPTQQAIEHWKTLSKTGVISFRAKGKDQYGNLKVAELGTFVKRDTPTGATAHALLLKYCVDSKKRKREDEEAAEDRIPEAHKEASRASKKARKDGDDNVFASWGWAPIEEEADEMEEDD